MHVSELVEVAGLLAVNSEVLLQRGGLNEEALTEYWTASRCRLDNWGRQLRDLGIPTPSTEHPSQQASPPSNSQALSFDALDKGNALPQLADEILASQIHTRVVAAVCSGYDRHQAREEACPIASNLLQAHGEAVDRLKALVHAWWPKRSTKSERIRTLTNRCERWTDLLLGYVLPYCNKSTDLDIDNAIQYAFDPARAQEFAYDAQTHSLDAEYTQRLLTTSIRAAFQPSETDAGQSKNAHLNRRIAGATLGLFGAELFDDFGLLRSTWLHRLDRCSEDTLGMIDTLFGSEAEQAYRPPARWKI